MRPEAAKRLLEDPDLKESMSLLRGKYSKEFENADLSNKDGLYNIRIKYDLIRDFYSELQTIVNNESMRLRKE
jgi:hypothetical protein